MHRIAAVLVVAPSLPPLCGPTSHSCMHLHVQALASLAHVSALVHQDTCAASKHALF
jgi:hypothetical protein